MSDTITFPDVSVIIPTRDRWDLLPRTLRAALAQRGPSLEVLVVDDGSQRPASGLPDDPRLRVVRRETSQGVAAARNLGVQMTSADWVAFLDDDDLWSPDKLAVQLAAARASGAGFAYTSALTVDSALDPLSSQPAPQGQDLLELLRRRCAVPAGASNVLVRRDLLRRVGGFDLTFRHLDDWDLWLRLAETSPAVAVPEPHVAYVQHGGNMVARAGETVFAEYEVLRRRGAVSSAPKDLEDFGRWVAGRLAIDERPDLRASRLALRAARRYRSAGLVRAAVKHALPRFTGHVPPPPAPAWLADLAEATT